MTTTHKNLFQEMNHLPILKNAYCRAFISFIIKLKTEMNKNSFTGTDEVDFMDSWNGPPPPPSNGDLQS